MATPKTDALIATFPNSCGLNELTDAYNNLLSHARQLEEQNEHLMEVLEKLRISCDESDACAYGTLSTGFVRYIVSDVLAKIGEK